MFIIDKILGPIETRCLLLICPETREAVLVDPTFYSFHHFSPIIKEKNLTLKSVLLTHSHWDHIADVAKFHDLGVPVYVHKKDRGNVIAPGSDGLLRAPKAIEGVGEVEHFSEGDPISFGECRGIVIETPGHSPGSVCFYFPQEAVLVSGDTLFRGGMGRLDLPTGQPELMQGSLDKLKQLPRHIKVYPGHGPITTIGDEF